MLIKSMEEKPHKPYLPTLLHKHLLLCNSVRFGPSNSNSIISNVLQKTSNRKWSPFRRSNSRYYYSKVHVKLQYFIPTRTINFQTFKILPTIPSKKKKYSNLSKNRTSKHHFLPDDSSTTSKKAAKHKVFRRNRNHMEGVVCARE